MNKRERAEYEACLKVYRDNKNIEDYRKEQLEEKFQKGRNIGRAEGILATARLMKRNGASVEFVKQCTGLSDEEIMGL